MIFWFSQSLGFHKCNLHRYAKGRSRRAPAATPSSTRGRMSPCTVGLYKFSSVDPIALESAPGLVTQPLNLKCDILVSELAFEFDFNLCTATTRAGSGRHAEGGGRGGGYDPAAARAGGGGGILKKYAACRPNPTRYLTCLLNPKP